MLNAIVRWSIAQRWLVVIAAILITLWGIRVVTQIIILRLIAVT